MTFVAFAAATFRFAGFNTGVAFREIARSRFAKDLGVACLFAPLHAGRTAQAGD